MTTKKFYEKPAMQEFELKHQPRLLAGSDGELDPLSPFEPGTDPLIP